MKKRLFLWAGIGLAFAVGAALVIPASRYPLLDLLRIERLHNGRPLEYWVASLKDQDPEARRRAALNIGDAALAKDPSLSDAETQTALAALIEAMADSDGFVRKCAATSFLMFPKETAVPQDRASIQRLTGALRDQEVVVRRAAVRGLWQAGAASKDAEGVARLTEALTDKDDFVRAYAARALARIGPDAKDAVPTLVARLREDVDPDVRKLSAKTLGLIGRDAIAPLMPDTVEALTKGLAAQSPGLREYAARSLGQLGAKEAIPALRQALKDRDELVRAAAAEALKTLEQSAPEKTS